MNHSESESDNESACSYNTKHRARERSTVNNIASTTSSLSSSNNATNGNGNNDATKTAKKKHRKFGNRMEPRNKKITNKPKTAFPALMFTNYIPLASDLFCWALKTNAEEFRSDNKLQLHFPLRGMNIADYNERMSKANHSSKDDEPVIPKTDEELPEIFKEYYRKNRREYLSRQKNDQETNSNSSRVDTESSTKENGNGIEEITIYDSDDEQEFTEPLQSKNSLNGFAKKLPNTRKVKNLSRLPSTTLTRMSSATKVFKKSRKSTASVRQREEVHERANQHYKNPVVQDHIKGVENRTKSKWEAENEQPRRRNRSFANSTSDNENDDADDDDSSSSSSNDIPFKTPSSPKKLKTRETLAYRAVSTRSNSKRSLRNS